MTIVLACVPQALDWFLSMPAAKHRGKAGSQLVVVKAFRLQPLPRTPTKPGILDIDGELVPFGSVEVRAHPGKLRVLTL